ncbi:hypothetical protein [Nocardia wallacei]|nr:hypothetical protein [Nocardia wallacei]
MTTTEPPRRTAPPHPGGHILAPADTTTLNCPGKKETGTPASSTHNA